MDGPIDAKYQLTEAPSADYLVRTERNVRDSDATVIFTVAAKLSGGSKKTMDYAKKHGKPVLHLPRDVVADYAAVLVKFLSVHNVKVLNVAGSRGGKEPGLEQYVREVLAEALLT